MNLKAEIFTGIITIGTTFIFTDFLIELGVGVAVYFTSRIVYKHCGDWVNCKINVLKKWLSFKKLD